jgi:hypothetical protein
VIKGLRKAAGAPLEIGKDPISIFAPYELETRLKELIEIHRFLCRSVSASNRAGETSSSAPSGAERRLCPDKTGAAHDLLRFDDRWV